MMAQLLPFKVLSMISKFGRKTRKNDNKHIQLILHLLDFNIFQKKKKPLNNNETIWKQN